MRVTATVTEMFECSDILLDQLTHFLCISVVCEINFVGITKFTF